MKRNEKLDPPYPLNRWNSTSNHMGHTTMKDMKDFGILGFRDPTSPWWWANWVPFSETGFNLPTSGQIEYRSQKRYRICPPPWQPKNAKEYGNSLGTLRQRFWGPILGPHDTFGAIPDTFGAVPDTSGAIPDTFLRKSKVSGTAPGNSAGENWRYSWHFRFSSKSQQRQKCQEQRQKCHE